MSRHIHAPAYSANVQRCRDSIEAGTFDPFGGKEHIAADKLLDVVTAPDPVVTSHVYPPIPDRSHDWIAHRREKEEAGPYGNGPTEAAAVADLREQEDAERWDGQS